MRRQAGKFWVAEARLGAAGEGLLVMTACGSRKNVYVIPAAKKAE